MTAIVTLSMPAGKVSVRRRPLAGAVPALVKVSVKVTGSPGPTRAGCTCLVSTISADVIWTGVVATCELVLLVAVTVAVKKPGVW